MMGTASVRSRYLLIGRLAVLSFVLLAVASCGIGKGTLSGQVLYQGKPLPGGIVMFRPVNTAMNPVTAVVDQNGNYEAKVPTGECKISVDNRGLLSPPTGPVGVSGGGGGAGGRRGPPKGVAVGPPKGAMDELSKGQSVPDITPPQQQAGTYVPIPKEFYDPETSGLTVTVKSGNQSHNIELTKK